MTTTTTSASRRSAARTRDLVLAALSEATEPITVKDLAEKAGVGKSTLAKYLPALEKDGLAVRTPGGRDGRRRLPDTWQTATSTTPNTDTGADTSPEAEEYTEEETDTVSTTPDITAESTSEMGVSTSASEMQATFAQVASGQPSADEVATATVNDQEAPTQGSVPPTPPVSPRPAPVLASTATATSVRVGVTATQGLNPISGSTRLAPGELKLMVKAILDAEPGEEFTATAISHLLQGRSIGAIQNNLARLAKEGKVAQTCDRPRRYRSVKHQA